MYSRQNRNARADVSVDLPRDYSGSAFYPFPTHQETPQPCSVEKEKNDECVEKGNEREEKKGSCERKTEESVVSEVCCPSEPEHCRPGGILPGLSGLLGGNIGLEELLLLGVIFLVFSDNDLKDNELLICLLLILFI